MATEDWVTGSLVTDLLIVGAAISAGAFALAWYVCTRIGNYGFLDAIWSLSVAVLAPIYAYLGHGDLIRRLAFTAVGMAWSLRLGSYMMIRVWRHHPQEDKRYRTLREKWPGPARFLLFFELQALIAVLFSLPFLLASLNPRPGLGVVEVVGLGIALVSTVGESIADWQAQRFKRNPANRDAVLDEGLWRYSRHPNYFFESMVWWGFFIAALGSPSGWITVLCPLLMMYFLLCVTGVALTEKHSLESRGDAYRNYQRTTSQFIPWFKEKSS